MSKESGRGSDVTRVSVSYFHTIHILVNGQVRGGIPRVRLRNAAQPHMPGVFEKRILGAKPVSRIRLVMPVPFCDQPFRATPDEEDPVISTSRHGLDPESGRTAAGLRKQSTDRRL